MNRDVSEDFSTAEVSREDRRGAAPGTNRTYMTARRQSGGEGKLKERKRKERQEGWKALCICGAEERGEIMQGGRTG